MTDILIVKTSKMNMVPFAKALTEAALGFFAEGEVSLNTHGITHLPTRGRSGRIGIKQILAAAESRGLTCAVLDDMEPGVWPRAEQAWAEHYQQ